MHFRVLADEFGSDSSSVSGNYTSSKSGLNAACLVLPAQPSVVTTGFFDEAVPMRIARVYLIVTTQTMLNANA